MKTPLSGPILLVGAGKMGGAMLQGWRTAGVEPGRLSVLDPYISPDMAESLTAAGIAINPAPDAISTPAVLLVAVKPQVLDLALQSLAEFKQHKPLILSVVAGKTIAAFQAFFGKSTPVIRAMPNTPAAIGRGITGMTASPEVTPVQKQLAHFLLSVMGEVVDVASEDEIDAVTAVSGSGPAYIFYLTECLSEAAESLGLTPETARQLARATVSGAAELMRVSGTEADKLRKDVASPNGTTQAALEVLMAQDGLSPLLRRAVKAARDRARELSL